MLGWALNLGFAGSGADAPADVVPFRSRTNDFNRRRYGGLWAIVLLALRLF